MTEQLKQGFSFGGWIPDTLKHATSQVLPLISQDEYWMSEALRVAMTQIGKSAPNPTVGCLFVNHQKVLVKGATMTFGGYHAERVAIESCQNQDILRNSTCYVTLEPCAHHGKQPPCVDALLKVGIKRCVIGLQDPFPQVNGKSIQILKENGVEVVVGIMAAECAAWHFPFLAQQVLQRPIIIGKWAQTLDGHLADDIGQSKWITGPEAREYTHWLRQKYDAIAVGGPTALLDQPELSVRDCAQPIHRQPKKMIYDPKGRLREANPRQKEHLIGRLFQGETVFWGINQSLNFTSEDQWIVDQDRLVVVPLTEKNATFVDFLDLVTELFPSYHDGKPLQSLLVEGGPTLLTSLLDDDALDLIHVFVNPSLVGGQKHRIGSKINQRSKSIETKLSGRSIRARLQFRPISLNQLGQDLVWDIIPESRFETLWQPMMRSNSSSVEAFS